MQFCGLNILASIILQMKVLIISPTQYAIEFLYVSSLRATSATSWHGNRFIWFSSSFLHSLCLYGANINTPGTRWRSLRFVVFFNLIKIFSWFCISGSKLKWKTFYSDLLWYFSVFLEHPHGFGLRPEKELHFQGRMDSVHHSQAAAGPRRVPRASRGMRGSAPNGWRSTPSHWGRSGLWPSIPPSNYWLGMLFSNKISLFEGGFFLRVCRFCFLILIQKKNISF